MSREKKSNFQKSQSHKTPNITKEIEKSFNYVQLLFFIIIIIISGIILYFALSSPKEITGVDNNSINEDNTQTNLQMGTIESVLTFNFKSKVESGEYIILDIRTPEEFEAGHIKGAINIDFYDQNFQAQINSLNRDKKYLVYCRSGSRSSYTLPLFEQLEFNEVYELQGGAISWTRAGHQLEGEEECKNCF
ncbi:MAG: rhodanese-like domain-containing protein [Nanoarchaeota archaeon]|nr:rhodanese-like domain-containing protein [Nanoarchaeota archaeon]